MALEALGSKLPEYANDIKLNLSSVFMQPELNEQQLWGTALAVAYITGQPDVIREIRTEAPAKLTPQALHAVKGAAAIMSMNNVYYRYQHLSSNEKYKSIPARLRMNIIRSHGVDPKDFELWSLAVSAINACSVCVDSHEKVLREKGISEEAILAAVRVASVVKAVSTVLQAEAAA